MFEDLYRALSPSSEGDESSLSEETLEAFKQFLLTERNVSSQIALQEASPDMWSQFLSEIEGLYKDQFNNRVDLLHEIYSRAESLPSLQGRRGMIL
tara:strand:- start:2188 stop:2475 length:288 start_codon:yes stop_codon:yes gene_type:complete